MMQSVPSVTMKGGIVSRVTSAPLSQPKNAPHSRPSGKATIDRQAVDDAEPAHHDRGNDHDDADRKIDAGGENDERLADAENARHHHLGQHGREIARGGEALRIDRDAEQQAEHQHDERHRRRIGVQKALQALERRKPLLLRRRRPSSSAPCRTFLEFLRRGRPS